MSTTNILTRHPAVAALPVADGADLTKHTTLRRLVRGEALWRAGEEAALFVVVGHGLVKEALPGRSLRVVTSFLCGPGEAPGLVDLLAGSPPLRETDAFALTEPAVVASIPFDLLRGALEKNGPAALQVAREAARHATRARRGLLLAQCPAEERIAAEILDLGDRFGDEMEDGSVLIPLRLTRADLASLCSTTVETTIRTLSRLDRDGVVSTVDGGLAVHDIEALRRRACLAPRT
jgi:CRP/FNR family transcriptional regulator